MEIKNRVEELLSRMTLEEKAAQVMQVPYNQVTREEALRWAAMGAGSFLHVLGDNARELQRAALQSRLGIPVLFGIDAIHGHGLNRHATIFPSQLATACAWDPSLAETMGRVTAREVATDGLHWTFSPVLCLGRDPRWGRIDETFGEDPTLDGALAAAIVRGYQGDSLDSDTSILACAKHYLGYGEAVGARDACDTECTERKIREVFLPPFRKAVEAGVATIMTAYGSIDGTPLTASRRLMKEILRDELGFDGFVVTDWNNCGSLIRNQHVAADMKEAAAISTHAGNDMIMSTLDYYEAAIRAVREGILAEADLDEAVRHILTVKVRMGLFEHPEKKGEPGCIGCEAHRAEALRAARKTLTLLKNDGLLPLRDPRRIAVIGPNADDIRAQYGDWTYFTHPDMRAHKEPVRPYVTVREGFEQLGARRGVQVDYLQCCAVGDAQIGEEALQQAAALAREADAVFLVLGDNVSLHGEYRDRANLSLDAAQSRLLETLTAVSGRVCVVLVCSKPLALDSSQVEAAGAVLCAFNGGMYSGQAVAEAAFGEIEPTGRLPISFPRHSGQVPVYYNSLPGWHGGKYCDLPEGPLWAFGEGMGYTSFAWEGAGFDPDTCVAAVTLTNTGDREGTENVQVYFRDLVSSVITPVKRLIAWQHVTLAPGERREVRFQLSRADFSLINAACRQVVEPGDFELYIGHSSREEDLLTVPFRLEVAE